MAFLLNLALRQDILKQCHLKPIKPLSSKICPVWKGVEKAVPEEILEDQLEKEFPHTYPYNSGTNNPPVMAPLPPTLCPPPQSNKEAAGPFTAAIKKGGELGPSRTRKGVPYGGLDGSFMAPLLTPLRQLPMGDNLAYVHTPFTTSDLFNW